MHMAQVVQHGIVDQLATVAYCYSHAYVALSAAYFQSESHSSVQLPIPLQ
jgi:hypothetical protein